MGNLPKGHIFLTDDLAPGAVTNAASPGFGNHALNMGDLNPTIRPFDSPYLISVGFGGDIVGHMLSAWSGFAQGKSNKDAWIAEDIEYNCHDTATYPSLPTEHSIEFDA